MKKSIVFKLLLMMAFVFTMSSFAVFARGWTTDGSDWYYYEDDAGNLATETIKSSGDEKYYLDANGFMVRDYLLEDYNGSVYYFDDSGKMVKNTWVAVDPTQVINNMENSPSIYLYYFGANGKAYKASSNGIVRKSIDGKKYLFNENGQMLSGWINEQGERYNEFNTEEDPFVGYVYYAGDETDGVLREGWSTYEGGSVDDRYYMRDRLWFYFKPGDNKKVYNTDSVDFVRRKINGHTYAFDENGVMIEGWDSDTIKSMEVTNNYFSINEEDAGRMNKKEWIFAVPSEEQELEDHDQEVHRWFYANGSGTIIKDLMKRINRDYYIFNDKGIMKSGLCVVDVNTKEFVDCIDIEKTDGKDFIISRHYISTETYKYKTGADVYELFDDSKHALYYFVNDETALDYGKRKTGDVKTSFADMDYVFSSTNQGEKNGLVKKKYYQAGISLKADEGLGLGLVLLGYSSDSVAAAINTEPEYLNSSSNYATEDVTHNNIKTDYIVNMDPEFCEKNEAYPVFAVVDARGNRIKASNTHKKDKSGYYWLFGANGSFVKCYEVPIRYVKSEGKWYFKSEVGGTGTGAAGGDMKIKTQWIEFGTKDIYDKTCLMNRNVQGDYEIPLSDQHATNFRFVDGF